MARKDRFQTDENSSPKAKINKENLLKAARIFNYTGKHRWKFYLGFLFLAMTGATALIFPQLSKELVNAASKDSDQLNTIGKWFLLLFIGQGIFSFFRVVLFVDVTENMLAAVRKDVYTHLIKLPMTFFTQRRVGELNSRLASDISQIHDTFTSNLAEFLRQIIIIVGGLTIMFIKLSSLALVMLATVPVVAILAVIFGRYIRRMSRSVQDKIADSSTIVEETLQGIFSVKSFANEHYETNRYSKTVDAIKKIALRLGKVRGIFISFVVTFMMGSLVFLLWYALRKVQAGELDPGDLVMFAFFTMFIAGSIGGIPEQYAQIQRGLGATDRVLELMDEAPEDIVLDHGATPAEYKINGEVVFNHIAFNYPSRADYDVLRDISLHANPGEKIALVGPSGAGKSTIVSLLLRFYEPTSGQILFDGKPSTQFPLTYLRNQMAIVPQDVLLFGGSIKENILYGKPDATDAEVTDAARKANAHDFISSFPEGYDTIVGERGVKLSGGQRQRIAIARAVLKNPSILLLDEATSSLDSESERLVQDALEELMKGRTSFIIAHRLSTIRTADKIVVIDKGNVVEIGTHAELTQMENGLYKKLSSMQFEPEQTAV